MAAISKHLKKFNIHIYLYTFNIYIHLLNKLPKKVK